MAKWQNDAMLDAGLAYITSNATEMYACSAQPANYAGIAAVALTSVVVPSFTGPADGDVNGRKITVDEKSGIPITDDGDGTEVVLASSDTLLYVATNDLQGLVSGGTLKILAWDIELRDPTA